MYYAAVRLKNNIDTIKKNSLFITSQTFYHFYHAIMKMDSNNFLLTIKSIFIIYDG